MKSKHLADVGKIEKGVKMGWKEGTLAYHAEAHKIDRNTHNKQMYFKTFIDSCKLASLKNEEGKYVNRYSWTNWPDT